ncbi:MAG: hypothetical protein IIU50_05560 [Bacteroidaceae bacterium]|nr:hypothetical protein [Bacteroidaceae bacterium]
MLKKGLMFFKKVGAEFSQSLDFFSKNIIKKMGQNIEIHQKSLGFLQIQSILADFLAELTL